METTSKTKKNTYKTLKDVPNTNPNQSECEFFLNTKMRFCKFQKMDGSKFCNHHNLAKGSLCERCKHMIFTENQERHSLVCKVLKEEEYLLNQKWYVKDINLLRKVSRPNENEEKEKIIMTDFIKKIKTTYENIKKDYQLYITTIDNEKYTILPNNRTFSINNYLLSGISPIDTSDLNSTLQLPRLEKHSKQTILLSKLMKDFGLFKNKEKDEENDEKDVVFIEFGAGKGGLTERISHDSSHKFKYVLLEREGVRYKKDKSSEKIVRYRTDILNFNMNFLLTDSHHSKKLIGIAKHICGCALDISITSLINVNDSFHALCFASCCHHLGSLSHFLGYDKMKNEYNFKDEEILLMFKLTSWLFDNENMSHSENDLFSIKEKQEIGLICKYIIDLSRCLYLISHGKDVFYIKYCSNEITTENNVILAINPI